MAGRKAFSVKVELDLQAATCPGVWFRSNGQVSLQMYMLDSCVQTSSFRPSFPMLFHEQFIFSKTLPTKYHLEDLFKQLSREWLYVEMIQWENCEYGNVLAYFQIPLNELLYPNIKGGMPTGGQVDLLMEPTPAFPGALAPKLEVNTKTTIEETLCSCMQEKPYSSNVVNPKMIQSCTGRPRGNERVSNKCTPMHNKCHRDKKCKTTCVMRCKVYDRPPWRYKKVDDGFLSRRPVMGLPHQPIPQLDVDGGVNGGPYGGPRRMQPDRGMEIRKVLKESLRKTLGQPALTGPCSLKDRNCMCGGGHAEICCTVCQKYSGIFSNKITEQDPQRYVCCSTPNPDATLYNQLLKQSRKNFAAQGDHFCPEIRKMKKFCEAHAAQGVCKIVQDNDSKKSMATKIHDRVSKTLQSIPICFENIKDTCTTNVKDFEEQNGICDCDLMPDMKKFYKELFQDEFHEEQQK